MGLLLRGGLLYLESDFFVFLFMFEGEMIGIVLGIAMFMLLVIIHELGHFWAAKKSGVKIKEFGI